MAGNTPLGITKSFLYNNDLDFSKNNKFGNTPLGVEQSNIWDKTLNSMKYSDISGNTLQKFETENAQNMSNTVSSAFSNIKKQAGYTPQVSPRGVSTNTNIGTNTITDTTGDGNGLDIPESGDSKIWNKAFQAAGTAMSAANQFAWNSSKNKAADIGTGQQANEVRSGISDAMINSGNPYVAAAGLATKVVDGVVDATGLRSANYSKSDLKSIGLGNDKGLMAASKINNAMNYLPGSALLFGNVSGQKLSNMSVSQDTENVAGSFAGTMNQINSAKKLGGTSMAWYFGSANQKMEDKIQELQQKANTMGQISRANTLRINNNYGQELSAQNTARYSGSSASGLAVGKKGLVLPDKEELLKIKSSKKEKQEDTLPGIETSVIPDGALHAHKNHLEEVNSELDEVTEKGIPVIITDENADYQQVAEIEVGEIIIKKDLTEKLEEMLSDLSEKNFIKAGKLVAKEIMCNTEDNTEELLDGDD